MSQEQRHRPRNEHRRRQRTIQMAVRRGRHLTLRPSQCRKVREVVLWCLRQSGPAPRARRSADGRSGRRARLGAADGADGSHLLGFQSAVELLERRASDSRRVSCRVAVAGPPVAEDRALLRGHRDRHARRIAGVRGRRGRDHRVRTALGSAAAPYGSRSRSAHAVQGARGLGRSHYLHLPPPPLRAPFGPAIV